MALIHQSLDRAVAISAGVVLSIGCSQATQAGILTASVGSSWSCGIPVDGGGPGGLQLTAPSGSVHVSFSSGYTVFDEDNNVDGHYIGGGFANARYGSLKSTISFGAQNALCNFNSTSSIASFDDTLVVNNLAGTGFMQVEFDVAGSIYTGGGAAGDGNVVFDAVLDGNMSRLNITGDGEHQETFRTAMVPIAFGEVISFGASLALTLDHTTFFDIHHDGSAQIDFGNSANFDSIRIFDDNMNLIDAGEYTLTSGSGTDYSQPIPAPGVLMAAGLGGLIAGRRRRQPD